MGGDGRGAGRSRTARGAEAPRLGEIRDDGRGAAHGGWPGARLSRSASLGLASVLAVAGALGVAGCPGGGAESAAPDPAVASVTAAPGGQAAPRVQAASPAGAGRAAAHRAARGLPGDPAADGAGAPNGAANGAGAPALRFYEDRGRGEVVFEYGPVDLPARAGHHDVRQLGARIGRMPADGWLRGFRVELVDADGRPVPQAVLHHVNVVAMERRELFSPIMRRIAAAGQETPPYELPRIFGYPVRRGERVLVTAMFHNPTPRAYHGVRLRGRMRHTPPGAWPRPIPIYPFYVDVMPPASRHAYDLPPGRSAKSWEGRPAVSGRILGLGGHLHQYGVLLRFEDVTAGKVLWETRPVVDRTGAVVRMPTRTFYWRLGLPLRADHVYRLTAIYDNPTGRTIPLGAMGALGGALVPARGARWPAVDPGHPDYRRDLELLHQADYGAAAYHH